MNSQLKYNSESNSQLCAIQGFVKTPVNSQLKYNYSYPVILNFGSREYYVFLKAIHNGQLFYWRFDAPVNSQLKYNYSFTFIVFLVFVNAKHF